MKQIINQIDSWQTSPEQKEQAKKEIVEMSEEQLEQFLIKNKLIKTPPQEQTPTLQTPENKKALEQATPPHPQECPFCLISKEKINSYKIDENSKSLAILEINPLSKGHIIILPKQHKKIEKIPSQAFTLAKKIATKLKRKLKPQSVSIQTAEIFGHGAINVIPVYENKKLEKYKASEDELKELQEKLKSKPKKPRQKKERKTKTLPQYPRRIP